MKLLVTLGRDESGMTVAECPAIPGCISQGRTEDEAYEPAVDKSRTKANKMKNKHRNQAVTKTPVLS